MVSDSGDGSNRDERNKTLATFGYVSFAVAVGAFYFWMFYDMGASSARYRVEQEQASQAYSENASKEVRAECAGRSDRATCEREIEHANREGQRNEKDLEAQRGMSDWAFWLLVISAFQFPATLVALVFVKRTLDATLKAVEDTSIATKAMERQNEIALEGGRAWVSVKLFLDGGFKPGITHSGIKGYYLSLGGIAKNHGKTPATAINFRAKLVLGGVNLPSVEDAMENFWIEGYPDIPNSGPSLFAEQECHVGHELFLSQSEIDAALAQMDFKMISPSVIAFLSYQTPSVEGIKRTSISQMLTRVKDGQAFVIDPTEGNWTETHVIALTNLERVYIG